MVETGDLKSTWAHRANNRLIFENTKWYKTKVKDYVEAEARCIGIRQNGTDSRTLL